MLKSVSKELKHLFYSFPVDNVISVDVVDDDLTHLKVVIEGPIDSPFENALFTLDVRIPSEYRFKPPKFKFDDKIFHPNVDFNTGEISLDILRENWSPALTIEKVALSICSLLGDPNPDDPINHTYRGFERRRRLCTTYSTGDW